MKAIMILTGKCKFDLECQIVVHSDEQAKREIKDLKKMGLDDARSKVFEDEGAAYAWYDNNR